MKFFNKWVRQTFKNFGFAISLTIVLTITILILIGVVLAQQSLLLTKSTAQISLQGQVLSVTFNINPIERPGFEAFSQTLGADNRWLDGISMTIDQKTADQLKVYLPRDIKVEASARKLAFNSGGLTILTSSQLSSALPSKDGQISVYQGEGSWNLVVTDVGAVIAEATSSGQLKLAVGAFEQFWPVLSKFATIRAEIGSDRLRGNLILK